MTFDQWIAAVVRIGEGRGLTVRVSRPSPGRAVFTWIDGAGVRSGTAGAGAELLGLTTPESFTWDWYGVAGGGRGGHYVPRVPARAVSWSMGALFR